MLEELEARIRRLEAIEEIKNLHARYVYSLDTFQFDKLLDVFADNFEVAEYVGFGTFKTKAELLKYFEDARPYLLMCCHQSTTPLIEVDGDKATGLWYFFGPLTFMTPQGEVACWEQGRYKVEYQRGVDGKWKITRFKCMMAMNTPYEDGWVKNRFGPTPSFRPEALNFRPEGL